MSFFFFFFFCVFFFFVFFFFFSSRRRHTRWNCDWSSDVCSSDLKVNARCTFTIALTLSVPLVDWFTPCENAVTVRGVRANQRKNSSTSSSSRDRKSVV